MIAREFSVFIGTVILLEDNISAVNSTQAQEQRLNNRDWLQKPDIIHGFEGGKTVALFGNLCLLWASQTPKQHRRKLSQQSMSGNMDLRMILNFTLLHSPSEKLNITIYIFFRISFTYWLFNDTVLTARYIWWKEGIGEKIILACFKALSQSWHMEIHDAFN